MHNTTPQIIAEGTVIPNGDAAQVYFEKAYTQQIGFPLEPGNRFTSLLVPDQAIVLLPERADFSFPVDVTVRSADQYQLDIEMPDSIDTRDKHRAERRPADIERGNSLSDDRGERR
ncbi:hypothetical protein SAMN05216226_102170 [Halovenus aranensis]|uniref:Uncharacterized protein n=1 Tax=Halovenus aranensis TaxID=890420 RepID=A0A1G8SVM9_9EURY|nr:hypothetical protein [Halovenus aranensis]SDJ33309.1 hypothetical protein SAMN05216226_102170 [Halovenus aranensis]